MNRRFTFGLWVLLLMFLSSCKGAYQINKTSFINLSVSSDSAQLLDQTVLKIIKPYQQKLDSQMTQRIMVASQDLEKASPEGSLGNMVCDELMRYALNKGHAIDVCVFNAGGLRIPVIYKGDIFVRTIFELLPFDNELVVLDLTGVQLISLLDLVAANGGWPVSGVRMKIGQSRAQDIQFVNGRSLEPDKYYRLLTSDYLAGGGDNAFMLKNAANYESLAVMMRNALIEQLKDNFYSGETLQAVKDGRITKE